MSEQTCTKSATATVLKQMLLEQPLQKISIKDIAEAAGISRNTFYYHFKDKFELVHWIFCQDLNAHIPRFNNFLNLNESFISMCQFMYDDRPFYYPCLLYKGPHSLYEYMYGYYESLIAQNTHFHSAENSILLNKTEHRLLCMMKTHALIGYLEEWVASGMDDSFIKEASALKYILDYVESPILHLRDARRQRGRHPMDKLSEYAARERRAYNKRLLNGKIELSFNKPLLNGKP